MTAAHPVTFDAVAGLAAKLLLGSAFRDARHWSKAIVVLEGDGQTVAHRVTSRGDFSAWLRHHDLPTLATECLVRSVPRGCVLVWLSVDGPDGTGVRFTVLDLATGEVRR